MRKCAYCGISMCYEDDKMKQIKIHYICRLELERAQCDEMKNFGINSNFLQSCLFGPQ